MGQQKSTVLLMKTVGESKW